MVCILNNTSYAVMQKSLDAVWLRQQVIADNIANIDTPGYKSKTVQFEALLKQALAGDSGRLEEMAAASVLPEPQILESAGSAIRADGNNVDVDGENIQLVRTQLQYEYMTRKISDEFSRLRYAISEGRK